MEQYVIKGGNPLVGEVEIAGAKNAALAILAAAIMTDETILIENLPCLLYTSLWCFCKYGQWPVRTCPYFTDL